MYTGARGTGAVRTLTGGLTWVSHVGKNHYYVQWIVQMGIKTVSAPKGDASRPERVPSPSLARRVYMDESSHVIRASFIQLSGYGEHHLPTSR